MHHTIHVLDAPAQVKPCDAGQRETDGNIDEISII